MFDEIEELRHIDPIRPEHLVEAVAVDRDLLARTFEADRFTERSAVTDPAAAPGSARRVGYVGAGLAVAAAFTALAFVGATFITDADRADPATPTDEAAPAATASTLLEEASGASAVEAATSDEPQVLPPPGDDDPEGQPAADGATDAACDPAVAPCPDETVAATDASTDPVFDLLDGPFDPAADLLVLHFDSRTNFDDAFSAVAALEVTSRLGLESLVVHGTRSGGTPPVNEDAAVVIAAAWGDEWLDADADRELAVTASAERWLTTLDAGGSVWVAEAGPSTLTAEVVREVVSLRPDLDPSTRIHVIQHSGHNERNTGSEDLAYVRSALDYQRIDDGNEVNGTADFEQPSPAFVAAALEGRHAEAWSTAFELFGPDPILDFSDTVTVLHILGITVDEVADPNDFADVFLA